MLNNVQLTYRHCEPSEALSQAIREQFEDLQRFYARVTGAHVIIEHPSKHHRHGQSAYFHVRIELSVPGERLVVSREPMREEAEDPFVAVSDAFEAARRQLQDFARRQRDRSSSAEVAHAQH